VTTDTTEAPPLTPEHSEGIGAAVRHLSDGPIGREAALEALTDAGFSERTAERIVATIVAELGRVPRPARAGRGHAPARRAR
jgi:hypothetical protein